MKASQILQCLCSARVWSILTKKNVHNASNVIKFNVLAHSRVCKFMYTKRWTLVDFFLKWWGKACIFNVMLWRKFLESRLWSGFKPSNHRKPVNNFALFHLDRATITLLFTNSRLTQMEPSVPRSKNGLAISKKSMDCRILERVLLNTKPEKSSWSCMFEILKRFTNFETIFQREPLLERLCEL